MFAARYFPESVCVQRRRLCVRNAWLQTEGEIAVMVSYSIMPRMVLFGATGGRRETTENDGFVPVIYLISCPACGLFVFLLPSCFGFVVRARFPRRRSVLFFLRKSIYLSPITQQFTKDLTPLLACCGLVVSARFAAVGWIIMIMMHQYPILPSLDQSLLLLCCDVPLLAYVKYVSVGTELFSMYEVWDRFYSCYSSVGHIDCREYV